MNIIKELSNNPLINIEFNKSKSKRFQDAVNLISNLPNYKYDELNNKYSCEFYGIKDYAKNYILINELVSIISKWKSTVIIINGKIYPKKWDYYEFKEDLNSLAGPYEIVFKSHTEYGMDSIVFEDLPLPLVYYPGSYGAFFAFAEDVKKEIYFCECERKAIENYVKLKQKYSSFNEIGLKNVSLGRDFPKHISLISQNDRNNPLSQFYFKENICFRCNNKIPILKYCHPMYGTLFKQKYGWYVNQKFFELGIDKCLEGINNVLIEECPPQLYDEIIHYNKLFYQRSKGEINNELESEIIVYKKGIDDIVENIARVELGFSKIGEYWTSEVVMFKIVEGIYPDYKSKRHHRPKWLEGLEVDIFFPEINMAFEYQGIQHYEPVEHWGGLKQLEKQQRHDKRKMELCKEYGVDLIVIGYNEELSTDYIKRKVLHLLG